MRNRALRIARRLALGLSGLLLAAGALAADAKVRGTVKDTAGAPVAEAAITLTDAGSGRKYEFKSGKDGSFYQRGVLPATYDMKVERQGYRTHILEQVKVQAGLERKLDVVLKAVEELRKEQQGAYGEGFESFQKGDYEAAMVKADEAIAKDPQDPKGYDMKAKALVSLKRYAEAVPLLEHELTLPGAPEDVKTVLAATAYNAGVVALREDRTEDAIGFWEKARESGHADPEVDNHLGRAYLARQDFARARARLESYLERAPEAEGAAGAKVLIEQIQKLEAAAGKK